MFSKNPSRIPLSLSIKSHFKKPGMDMNQFFVAGINYRKSDTGIRGDFAVNTDQYASLLQKAGRAGLSELFVLSTCNRTEIYGLTGDVNLLVSLLCNETIGDADTFRQLCYIKQGSEAIEHIFSVAAGLDSAGRFEVFMDGVQLMRPILYLLLSANPTDGTTFSIQ